MDTLYHLVTCQFEAACKIESLPKDHRASKLHGHSYQVSLRVPEKENNHNLESLNSDLKKTIEPLNYSYLNETINNPTDENIARWLLKQIKMNQTERVSIQSTANSGVDIDNKGNAHIWRRYRFEAAHQLPNVPPGHQCGRMHGHGFEVILHVNQTLYQQDMGIDFNELDVHWLLIHRQVHQSCLNHIHGLENPTSEIIAHWIWQQLKPDIAALSWVTVYETHTSGCNYNGTDYRIWKEMFFESAIEQNNKLQGHSYKIRLHLMSELDEILGWTVDYGDVKSLFEPVYKQLDHHRLEFSTELNDVTLAELSQWIKHNIVEQLPQLDRIDLFEKPGYGVQLCWGKEGPSLPD